MSEHFFPARVPEAVYQRTLEAGLAAHRAIGCRGYSRVDFIIDESGAPYILEVNTLPGMTATSLLPDIAKGRRDIVSGPGRGNPADWPAVHEAEPSISRRQKSGANGQQWSRAGSRMTMRDYKNVKVPRKYRRGDRRVSVKRVEAGRSGAAAKATCRALAACWLNILVLAASRRSCWLAWQAIRLVTHAETVSDIGR